MWIFSRLFGNKRADNDAADETEAPKQADNEIERAAPPLKIADLPEESDAYLRDTKWPPDPRFNKSFTVLQVFNQQGGLIRRICSAMPLSDEDLERYFLPAVWNVANFVHLLSASQDTHHRGYGGLFAHSLETALYAVNISKNKIFDFSEAPDVAFHNRGRWILACALAGLVHDVGKAVTDITVRTKQGEEWNPNEAPLGTWLEMHGRPEFTFSWNNDREYARHPLASLDYARKLVPDETYRYLTSAANRNIENELRSAILGGEEAKSASLIAQIIRQADSLSVRLDNETAGSVDKRDKLVTSEPADKVMQAIAELIAEKVWTVNEENARVFVTKRGTFLLWSDVRDILSKLRAQGYAGAPENRDIMASMLLDRGLFERPPEEVDTTRRLYWPLCPIDKGEEFLTCVKVAVPERLFIGPMPAETLAIVRKLPVTDEESEAWLNRWGCVPAEEEKKHDTDAYMSGLISEGDDFEDPEVPESENAGDFEEEYAELFSNDLDYNGLWGAEWGAEAPVGIEHEVRRADGTTPSSAVGTSAADSGAESSGASGVRVVSESGRFDANTSLASTLTTTLPDADEMLSEKEAAAMMGLSVDVPGAAAPKPAGPSSSETSSDTSSMSSASVASVASVSSAAAFACNTEIKPDTSGDKRQETKSKEAAELARNGDAERTESLHAKRPEDDRKDGAADVRLVCSKSDAGKTGGNDAAAGPGEDDADADADAGAAAAASEKTKSHVPDFDALSEEGLLIFCEPLENAEALRSKRTRRKKGKEKEKDKNAEQLSAADNAANSAPSEADLAPKEHAQRAGRESSVPSSPVRQIEEPAKPSGKEFSKSAAAQNASRTTEQKSGRRGRRRSAKDTPTNRLRAMLEDLKSQMLSGEGPYVELGVVKMPNGTLTTNSMAFEKALTEAGFDRMLVSGELSGFQPPPVLSVDWSKSVFSLHV